MANTTVNKVLFLVSTDSQRSKKIDGSHFWALECLLTASGWLESIRAIMAPPSSNVIPEPAQNRVKIMGLQPFMSCLSETPDCELLYLKLDHQLSSHSVTKSVAHTIVA